MQYTPHPDLMVTDLGDELMLVHGRTGEVFRMNGSARALWLALPCEENDIVEVLIRAFDVSEDQARIDCTIALQDWMRRGVLLAG